MTTLEEVFIAAVSEARHTEIKMRTLSILSHLLHNMRTYYKSFICLYYLLGGLRALRHDVCRKDTRRKATYRAESSQALESMSMFMLGSRVSTKKVGDEATHQ